MVVHLLPPSVEASDLDVVDEQRVGFVVSKAVGHAVTRNLVKRRLRHLVRERLGARAGGLPPRGMLVVRALPAAAGATYDDLAGELDRCLEKLCRTTRSPATTGVTG
jgi:ribonuclease P protein component